MSDGLKEKLAEYKRLVGKPYEIGDVVWVHKIIGTPLPTFRVKFKIEAVEKLDGEMMFVGRPECFSSLHYVPWYFIDGYEFTCPICGSTSFIKGKEATP